MSAQPTRTAPAAGQTAAATPAPAGGDTPDPEPRQRLGVEIVEESGDWSGFGDGAAVAALIGKAASAVAAHPVAAARLPQAPALAVVALADDAAVAALNERYRGKARPTNVLSFPAASAPPGSQDEAALGDIVLAAETVMREAAELAIPPQDHLRHLIVHGLLHLMGYDHIEPAEADRMEALEIEILSALGIANPYAGTEPLLLHD